jgi:DNA-binding transcriptional regulator LsrR (DeoR family)
VHAAEPSAASTGQPTDTDHRVLDREDLLVEVAWAYYERDLTQAQIGAVHGISRSQVSRYLQAAREEGIVQIRIVPPRDRVPELEAALRGAFPQLREVIVARVFNREPLFIRRAVASAAARVFDRLIRPGLTVCVGAGRTMALAAEGVAPRRLAGLVVVPATGNAGHAALDADYSAITQSLADTLGGIAYRINAPAIVGANASAADLADSNPQIHEALAIARRADLYLLGLGSLAGDEIFVRTGLISAAELAAVRGAGAVGDLCGNFFDGTGRPVQGPFEDRVVGIGLDDLRRATLVVACAGGEEKAPAIVGALRGRLIHGLVTDEHTAERVLVGVRGGRSSRRQAEAQQVGGEG